MYQPHRNEFPMDFHLQWQQPQQQQQFQPPPNLHHQQQQQHHQFGPPSNSSYKHQSAPKISSNSTSDQSSIEEISSKRKQSLERNRLAAYRCRERKKNEQQQMIEQADFLSMQNESLNMMVGDLRNEVIALRELLLAHDSCHCEGVQAFIRRTSSTL
ncbi:unnamed protein product [Mucor circinelloides]